MVIGFLRVSDVDDRTYVDCSTIPDMGMDKVRHLSRFWTSSALMSKLHPDQSQTEVMGRISESPGVHMPVCWSIRLVSLRFVFVQSLRPKPGRSLHFHQTMMFLSLASGFMELQCVIPLLAHFAKRVICFLVISILQLAKSEAAFIIQRHG